jgi:hypothetical protein
LVVIVRVPVGLVGEGRAGFDREAVRADVGRVERERFVESGAPVVERAEFTDVMTFAGSCVRPSDASTCGTIDCTPKLNRFTPPRRYARRRAGVTVSGLHSTVTSAPGDRSMWSSTLISASAGTSDGVPPPKNTLVADGMPSRRARSRSATHASRYESTRCIRSVHVANAQ